MATAGARGYRATPRCRLQSGANIALRAAFAASPHLARRLELVLVLERQRASAAAGRALISSTSRLRFGNFAHAPSPSDVRDQPRPAPHVHVDDRVGVAEHVLLLGEPRVEDAEVALRLEGVAVDRVGHLLRRVVAEVHRLAGIRADAGRDEHHPRQQFAARLVASSPAGTCRSSRRDRAGSRWSRTRRRRHRRWPAPWRSD